jgi:hypothetical protein
MKTIIIKFPQLCVDFKEVEVSDEEYNKIVTGDKSQYIWDNLTEQEQGWVPNGLNGIRMARENDYAEITTKITTNTIEP